MIYLDPEEVHREYEAMMKRPLPAWLDRAMLFLVALAIGSLATLVFS